MKTHRTTMTFKLGLEDIEQPKGVSMTVANETYTIRELLEKHGQGIMPDVQRNPVYLDGDIDSLDIDKVHRQDIVDKNIVKDNNLLKINDLQETIKTSSMKKEEEKQKLKKSEVKTEVEKATNESETEEKKPETLQE